MNPVTKFKTAFVKMTRDPSKHAEELEKTLNEFSEAGWDVTRFDHDMKKGTIVVGHRVELKETNPPVAVAIPPGMLSTLFGPPPASVGVSGRSREILKQVCDKMNGHKGPEDIALQYAVESVCRKYEDAALKAAVTEFKASAVHHRQHAHESPDEKCIQTEQLEQIALAIEKRVAQNVV